MRADCVPWTDDETEILQSAWADGKRKSEIAKLLDRSRSSIHSRMRTLGLVDNTGDGAPEPKNSEAVAADEAFKAAMQRAIMLGLERAQPGIVKDDTPLMPKYFAREPVSSGCGSSAQMCSESA